LENISGRFRGHVGKVVLIVVYVNKLLISYSEQILWNIRPFLKKSFTQFEWNKQLFFSIESNNSFSSNGGNIFNTFYMYEF